MKPNEIPTHDLTPHLVPVGELKLWPGNARRGDVDKIAYSMRNHGVFAAVVVQRSTNRIVKGNHTYQAFVEVHGADSEIPVVYVDVDDQRAARMNVVDNATSEAGTIDKFALREQLEAMYEDDIGSIDSSGYDDAYFATLTEDTGPLVINAADLVDLAGGLKPSRAERVEDGEISPEGDNSSRDRSTAAGGDLGVFVSFETRSERDHFFEDMDSEGYRVKRVG